MGVCNADSIAFGAVRNSFRAGGWNADPHGKLDLTALTVPEDHLADEGWKWEPTQEGGILTLRNFYQKCQHNNSGMISVKGKITLVLEGENVLETTSNLYQPLVSPNGENADWTIRESEAGGSLTLKMPEGVGTQTYYPYGFFADHFVVESGTIHSEMVLCFASTFEMKGGNVTIDKNTGIYAAIQTLLGDVNLNGGKLTVRNAVCGVAAKSQEAYHYGRRRGVGHPSDSGRPQR